MVTWKAIKDWSLAAFNKIWGRKILRYNLLWAILIIIVCFYLKHTFSVNNGNQISNVEKVISGLDDEEKIIKLNQISEGTEFEVSGFPFLIDYTVRPYKRRDYLRNDIYIKENTLIYKAGTDYSVYDLVKNDFIRKRLLTLDNKGVGEMVSDESTSIFFNALPSDTNKKDGLQAIYRLVHNVDSAYLVKYFVKDTYFNSDTSNRLLTIFNYYTYANNSFVANKYIRSTDVSNAKLINQQFSVPNFIGMVSPFANKVYIISKSSDKTLSLNAFFETPFSTPKKDTSKDNNLSVSYPFEQKEGLDNTLVASFPVSQSEIDIGIVSFNNSTINVGLVQKQNGKLLLLAHAVFPKKNERMEDNGQLHLIKKGDNIWFTYDNGRHFYLAEKKSDKEYEIHPFNNASWNEYSSNINVWFSANDFCQLTGQGFVSSNPKTNLFKVTKDDSAKLILLKNFEFSAYQNASQPEFIGTRNGENNVVVRVKRALTSKMEISIIGDISWAKTPFGVSSTVDYYYIIILTAFSLSLYFIGLSLIQTVIEEDPLASDTVKLIPTLTEKIKGIREVTYILRKRSNLMLLLGILFGIGGIISAYILFTMTGNSIGSSFNPKTTITVLRPVMLLVFIETFTFFFLKQYRVVFNEYKLFYSVYLKLLSYLHIVELAKDGESKKLMTEKLNGAFLAEKFELYESKATSAINEFDNEGIVKMLEALAKLNKAPGAG